MPYTQEELQELEWYQNLINADEKAYISRRDSLLEAINESGIYGDNGSNLIRDENGVILVFENPYTDTLNEDPESRVFYDTRVDSLKNDSSINEVLDREFEEL